MLGEVTAGVTGSTRCGEDGVAAAGRFGDRSGEGGDEVGEGGRGGGQEEPRPFGQACG